MAGKRGPARPLTTGSRGHSPCGNLSSLTGGVRHAPRRAAAAILDMPCRQYLDALNTEQRLQRRQCKINCMMGHMTRIGSPCRKAQTESSVLYIRVWGVSESSNKTPSSSRYIPARRFLQYSRHATLASSGRVTTQRSHSARLWGSSARVCFMVHPPPLRAPLF